MTGSDEDATIVRDQRILNEWRAHPGLGPSQVRNQLRRQGMKVSMHTVRCVLEDNGYVSPKVRLVDLITWDKIRTELDRLHLGFFSVDGSAVRRRTEITVQQSRFMNAIGVNEPPPYLNIQA